MGRKVSDRIGETYYSLKLLDWKTDRGRAYVFAECLECGNKKWIRADYITSGRVKTCGCGIKRVDLTNRKFGRLTVIKPTGECTSRGIMTWLCECECGNVIKKNTTVLSKGKALSCGCLLFEEHSKTVKTFVKETNNYSKEKVNTICITKKMPSSNTSGYKGVHWNKRSGKWRAEIMFQGKKNSLGEYTDIEAAIEARKKAEEKLFGGFREWFQEDIHDGGNGEAFSSIKGYIASKKSTKVCSICGKEFETTPKRDQKFCSRKCYEIDLTRGYKEMDERFSRMVQGKVAFWNEHAGEKHPYSKYWELQSPTGEIYKIRNLSYFLKKNQELFGADPMVSYGAFIRIKRTLKGKEKRQEMYSYKGWKLIGWGDDFLSNDTDGDQ